jgi:cephalosporin-C deacetylase
MTYYKPFFSFFLKLIGFFYACFFNSFSSQAQVKIALENPKATYAAKEAMYFKLNAPDGGNGTYQIYYDPREPDKIIKTGILKLRPNRDTFIFYTHPNAGVVFFKATVNGVSTIKTVTFDPLSIKPFDDTEPSDFDAFWDKQKAKLASIPLKSVITLLNTLPNGSKLYLLQLDQIDNRKVYGYLCVPVGAGKFPAILNLPAFGNAPFQADNLVTTDFAELGKAISLTISVHNTPPNVIDPNAYFPDDLTSPETMYNRYMVLAGIRAVDYLFSRPDFNGSLGTCGLSQGGGLAIMVAGLDKRVTALVASNPAHCEHQAWRFGQASGFPSYLKRAYSFKTDSILAIKSVKYHDATYFLKRFKGNARLLVGYDDDVTPAASIFPIFNQHRGASALVHMTLTGHSSPWAEYWMGRFDFFNTYLKDFKYAYTAKRTTTLNAGPDQLNVTASALVLKGEVKGEATILSKLTYKWSKVEGTGNIVFFNPNALTTQISFSKEGTYTLRLTAEDEYLVNDPAEGKYFTMSDYVTVQVLKSTPVEESNEKQNFKISPNPVENVVEISWNASKFYKRVHILDIKGNLIFSEKLDALAKNHILDVSKLASGFYLIDMENEKGGREVKKIVKK